MQIKLIKPLILRSLSLGLTVPSTPIDRYLELLYLKKLLTVLDINCVIDVGANRGQFAGELRKIGFQGQIISFEPIKQEFDVLSQSFEKDPKWKGYQIALGSEEKKMNIHIPRLTVMSSLLDFANDRNDIECQNIEVKRLDSIFSVIARDLEKPKVFLKMDTQGYDLEVFKGSEGCMDQIRGLQSELSIQPLYKNMPHYLEALSNYEDAGFELFNLSVVSRLSGGGLIELNCFMKRRNNGSS
ncbi:MAG: FkbM family methyltransferase [Leptospirales bacterium]